MSRLDFGRTIVLAPHPDDETLGCGGTLLRLKEEGCASLCWVLMTRMAVEAGYDGAAIRRRETEIAQVGRLFGFERTIQLPFSAAMLDIAPTHELVRALAAVFDDLQPETLLLPFPSDAHSDHRRTFAIASACSKWFRRKYLRRILCYEVPSETGFNLDPTAAPFAPNFYIKLEPRDVARKIEIMNLYEGEMAPFPFPRSEAAIQALALLRGSQCGSEAAEAYVLVRESL
ncbi:MAG: PIG-L deacetylase family protein [Gammaproteobacteria bacterium]